MIDEDDDLEDLDDDDEGDFDEDSDSEEVEMPSRRRGPPKGRGGAPTGAVNPEECKQQ